jgi:hypothetical protein
VVSSETSGDAATSAVVPMTGLEETAFVAASSEVRVLTLEGDDVMRVRDRPIVPRGAAVHRAATTARVAMCGRRLPRDLVA